MPLPGGSAGKAGVHYEDKWTTHCALDVLRGRASSIHIEPPGREGDGIEFWLRREDCTEYHQVKRQRAAGEWTVSALRDAGVLSTFETRLRDSTSRCVFVSMQSGSVFRELAEYARKATSPTEFVKTFLQAEPRRKEYEALRKVWPHLDELDTWRNLRRIEMQAVTEEILTSWICADAELLLEGDPSALPLKVARALQNSINTILYADSLWRLLEADAVLPAAWRGSAVLAVKINKANKRYICGRQGTLIAGTLIARNEAEQLIRAVEKGSSGFRVA